MRTVLKLGLRGLCLAGALTSAAACLAQGGGDAGIVLIAAPELNRIVPASARVEKVASGFTFTEGPVWRGGTLLFSDIPNNVIQQYDPATGRVTPYRQPSGNTNGSTLDSRGRLICCEHSGRRVSRQEADGSYTTLVDQYEGKRLNSPNDVVIKRNGALYFTDPPYGLGRQDEDPNKELPHNGVYRLHNGKLTLLTTELTRPNGLAFSPDEKFLYVANSDSARKIWMRYPVRRDGTLGPGTVFADVTSNTEDGAPDGMKVDREGNVFATGPGGVWIFSPEGKHLGTIKPAEVPANCGWGGADGQTLYMTARSGLYRIRTGTGGELP
ncbi:MAG: SMP-30/gluconolactonase/LRE family protein [Armatimonadota bacterium]